MRPSSLRSLLAIAGLAMIWLATPSRADGAGGLTVDLPLDLVVAGDGEGRVLVTVARDGGIWRGQEAPITTMLVVLTPACMARGLYDPS